jgi:FKBP-type peptidyl-prolyl cis-trans isomerase
MLALVIAAQFAFQTQTQGSGEPVVKDARVTVHFTAKGDDGTTFADTEARGMAFTFLMDQDTVEPFWHAAVRNTRVGAVRTGRLRASQLGLAVPGDPWVAVTVRVVKVVPL